MILIWHIKAKTNIKLVPFIPKSLINKELPNKQIATATKEEIIRPLNSLITVSIRPINHERAVSEDINSIGTNK